MRAHKKVKARLHECANLDILLFPAYSKGTKIVCAMCSSYSIWNIKYYNHIWAASEENLILLYANNTGADKPAQSVQCFGIRHLKSVLVKLVVCLCLLF